MGRNQPGSQGVLRQLGSPPTGDTPTAGGRFWTWRNAPTSGFSGQRSLRPSPATPTFTTTGWGRKTWRLTLRTFSTWCLTPRPGDIGDRHARPPYSFQQPSLGSLRRRPVLSLRQLGLVLEAQSVVPGGSRRLPTLRPQRLVNVVVTDRVNFLFADARSRAIAS